MVIYQVLPSLAFGDAIGNEVVAIYHALSNSGYKTKVIAEFGQKKVTIPYTTNYKRALRKIKAEDIVIYHLSTGSKLNYEIAKTRGHLIIRYHNITPGRFFAKYSTPIAIACNEGRIEAEYLNNSAEYVWADSEYNKQDLIKMGYKCPIEVIPILMALGDYEKKPSQEVIKKYSDGVTNLIFTGRIAPNKCYEDIIKTFYYYKKYFNSKSRLILVGNIVGYETYYKKLKKYIYSLGAEDIIFTGHISFEDILAYYNVADGMICMSEHEGFCVPLVEAMYFKVPIFAYNSSAISETMGEAGILLETKNALENAGIIDNVLNDSGKLEVLKEKQTIRINFVDNKLNFDKMLSVINRMIGE